MQDNAKRANIRELRISSGLTIHQPGAVRRPQWSILMEWLTKWGAIYLTLHCMSPPLTSIDCVLAQSSIASHHSWNDSVCFRLSSNWTNDHAGYFNVVGSNTVLISSDRNGGYEDCGGINVSGCTTLWYSLTYFFLLSTQCSFVLSFWDICLFVFCQELEKKNDITSVYSV